MNRIFAWYLIPLVLAVSACSASEPPAPAAQDATITGTEQVLRNAGNLDPSSLNDMGSLADAIDGWLDAKVRDCMARAGFPQLVRAQEMAVNRQPQGTQDPLRIDPLEMGPYTADQARSNGMVGSVLLLGAKREPGSVISRDPAYDSALAGCRTQANQLTNADTQQLLGQFTNLQNSVRAELVAAVEAPIRTLLIKRLECVRDGGYPSLDPAAAASTESFTDLLRDIGISPSEIREAKPAEPAIKPGQVLVVPPAQPARYQPPAAEVDFALAYVSCGERQDFVASAERLQSDARGKILTGHEAEIVSLGTALRDAAKTMTRP